MKTMIWKNRKIQKPKQHIQWNTTVEIEADLEIGVDNGNLAVECSRYIDDIK